ncbi:MAG: DUF4240 domain-containing protein [Oscillospiraceae bacterium]|nr:DUF4240 domain-containing protein [Oscillospiraceae bacterium]
MSIIMELFMRSQTTSKTVTDKDFWEIIDSIDHEYGGDSEAVISSIVRHLKHCEDSYIFSFDDKLCELIYALDGRRWAEDIFGKEEFAEDKFLSARCVAVAAGMETYTKVLGHREAIDLSSIHFHDGKWYSATDGLITAAAEAWSAKHLMSPSKYPHVPPFSIKSHSNEEMWK